MVKCSWGKESGDPNNVPVAGQVIQIYLNSFHVKKKLFECNQALTATQYPYGAYGQQLGYWYPQTYPTTTAAQMQGQFLQGMQGYAYGQFAGYQQSYMGYDTINVKELPIIAIKFIKGWGCRFPQHGKVFRLNLKFKRRRSQ